ncbi:MAG TPA: polymer-forming cytoskeletal protein [Vicinamibacterales bacterium]|nr:polymer-forming cytoskeletal protein [Vicinamibacterales bacterium]
MASDPNGPVDERRVAAWIGRALRIEGRIVSDENLTIDGQIEGTIEVGQHNLTIGAGATVKADLTAKTIAVAGTVNGSLTASERIDLRASASVFGDITTPRLVMDDGAVVKGKVQTGKKKSDVADTRGQ